MDRSYGGQSVDGLLEAFAQRTPAPGGGAATALTVAVSAGLAGMAARYSVDVLDDARQLADHADDCRTAAAQLAGDDGLAYGRVLAARDDAERTTALRAAAEVVLAIAEVGAEAAQLADRLAQNGKPSVRSDARTGAVLAAAATRAAVDLVRIDLSASGDDAVLLDRARVALERATAAGQGSG